VPLQFVPLVIRWRWVGRVGGAAVAFADADRCVYELEFVDDRGQQCREALTACWRRRFEAATPVRAFCWAKGQRNFPGLWWSATSGQHVGYESWLERDHVMLLDFDPDVVGVAAQPFWLRWHDGRRQRRHAPDFFARRGSDGAGVVVDVRADDRIQAKDAEAFDATAQACARVGWVYCRVGVPDPVLVVNVRWLSRYRHPRCGARKEVAGGLLEAFARPLPLAVGAAAVGDRLAVLPVLFHLMWRQLLVADLTAGPLGSGTEVGVAGAWGGGRR
jgi:hypothetical protein